MKNNKLVVVTLLTLLMGHTPSFAGYCPQELKFPTHSGISCDQPRWVVVEVVLLPPLHASGYFFQVGNNPPITAFDAVTLRVTAGSVVTVGSLGGATRHLVTGNVNEQVITVR